MSDLLRRSAPARQVADRLAAVPLLAPLARHVVDDFAERVALRTVTAGTRLVREGQPAADLHVVLSGQVALQRGTRAHLLRVRGPGEVFGEVELFDPRPWGYSAVTMSDVDVTLTRRADLLAWIGRHPAAAQMVLQHLAQRLSRDDRVPDGTLRLDLPARLARVLLVLADRYTDGDEVCHGLNQQQLGDLVGASREAVNKTLAGFADAGWLRHFRHGFVLVDRDPLQERATTHGMHGR